VRRGPASEIRKKVAGLRLGRAEFERFVGRRLLTGGVGTALTMDVFAPKTGANGAGVIRRIVYDLDAIDARRSAEAGVGPFDQGRDCHPAGSREGW
jgi:hypothetical protein